jgi:hypothetical protein
MSGRARKQARAAAIVDPAVAGAARLSVSLEQGWRAALGPPFFFCELCDERQGAPQLLCQLTTPCYNHKFMAWNA